MSIFGGQLASFCLVPQRQDPGRHTRKHGRQPTDQTSILDGSTRQPGRSRQLVVDVYQRLQQYLVCHGKARLGHWCQSDLQPTGDTKASPRLRPLPSHHPPPPRLCSITIQTIRTDTNAYQVPLLQPTLASARRTVATSLPIVSLQSDFWVCCHPTPLCRGCIGCGEARPSCPSLVNILPA